MTDGSFCKIKFFFDGTVVYAVLLTSNTYQSWSEFTITAPYTGCEKIGNKDVRGVTKVNKLRSGKTSQQVREI